MAAAMGHLPATIGEGEHQQPIMMGMLQAMGTLARDVQDLKMAAYRFWEGPTEWTYVTKGIEMRKEYGRMCSQARGTGRKMGGVKNYLLAAFFVAHQADARAEQAKKTELEEIIGKKVRNGEGKIDMSLFHLVAGMVTHIDVAAAKHANYITIGVTGTEGRRVLEILEETWGKQAKMQEDPPPPKPVLRELREAERKAREAMKGTGKGP